jgi:hypothetical protein
MIEILESVCVTVSTAQLCSICNRCVDQYRCIKGGGLQKNWQNVQATYWIHTYLHLD